MLFENKEKMNKQKTLLDNRQPFMNRVRGSVSSYRFQQRHEVNENPNSGDGD